jgi:predicted dehydrogenase
MAEKGPIRVGIVGLGRSGYYIHVECLRPMHEKFRIVAGCDLIEERAQKVADEFGARAYTDYKKLLKDQNVELVVVATRSHTHGPIAIEALNADKDALVEKPMALNVAEADKMIRTARKAGKRLLVHHNNRHAPYLLFAQEVIKSGILGKVFYVRECNHGFNRRNDWQTLKRFGGGLLNNWGPHVIDHALQLLGGLPVRMFSDLQRVAAAGDAEDHFKITMKGKTGLLVNTEVSGGIALGEPLMRVMGTHGAMIISGNTATLRYLDRKKLQPVKVDQGPPPDNIYGNQEQLTWIEETRPAVPGKPAPSFYEFLYQTIRRGRRFPISLEEARNVVWVTEKARKGTGF